MPTYSIKIRSTNRVKNQLRTLAAAHSQILDPIVKRWAQSTRGKLKAKPYPPKPPESKYRRTGRLASSFSASERMGIAWYRINNSAPYASWVIGDKAGPLRQAKANKHWWRLEPEIQKHLPDLRAAIERALSNV